MKYPHEEKFRDAYNEIYQQGYQDGYWEGFRQSSHKQKKVIYSYKNQNQDQNQGQNQGQNQDQNQDQNQNQNQPQRDYLPSKNSMSEYSRHLGGLIKNLINHYEGGNPIDDNFVNRVVSARKAAEEQSKNFSRHMINNFRRRVISPHDVQVNEDDHVSMVMRDAEENKISHRYETLNQAAKINSVIINMLENEKQVRHGKLTSLYNYSIMVLSNMKAAEEFFTREKNAIYLYLARG